MSFKLLFLSHFLSILGSIGDYTFWELKMNDKLILTLIDKFNSSSIGELELNDGTTRLLLRKEPSGERETPVSAELHPEKPVRLGIAAAAKENPGNGETITSPIVATFYSAPGPDAPPFVKPGAKVREGQTLCILEAMKMMNHLEAEFNCEIIETHVTNGDLVEYGQALFTVKRL